MSDLRAAIAEESVSYNAETTVARMFSPTRNEGVLLRNAKGRVCAGSIAQSKGAAITMFKSPKQCTTKPQENMQRDQQHFFYLEKTCSALARSTGPWTTARMSVVIWVHGYALCKRRALQWKTPQDNGPHVHSVYLHAQLPEDRMWRSNPSHNVVHNPVVHFQNRTFRQRTRGIVVWYRIDWRQI